MIVSWRWLADYLQLPDDAEEVVCRLALSGLNHESTVVAGSTFASSTTAQAVREGGYGAAECSFLAADAGEKIIDSSVAAIREIAEISKAANPSDARRRD